MARLGVLEIAMQSGRVAFAVIIMLDPGMVSCPSMKSKELVSESNFY